MTPPERIPLDGSGWRLKGFLGDTWRAELERDPASGSSSGWYPATVPGSVLHDLWRAGQVPDPYVDRNSLACEWVPERWWLYRCDVRLEAPSVGDRMWLHLEGLDFAAHVYLDGALVAEHRSQFTPAVIEIGDRLRRAAEPERSGSPGEDRPGPTAHRVEVLLEPAPAGEPQVGETSRVRTHRTRMTEGWDFCPRIPHLGIWRSARIERTGPARIADAWLRPRLEARAEGEPASDTTVPVDISVRIDAAGDTPVEVSVSLSFAGNEVEHASSGPIRAGDQPVELSLTVHDARRWWPNGHGEQALYSAYVDVRVDGVVSDTRAVPLGLRTIRLVRNEGAPADARPYTFEVNGRRIYARGWNWVPVDALYGVPLPDRLGHLLRLAHDANVNLLRVWGGGLIESEAFYDQCDRSGIMVWQEFVQSSSGIASRPPDDPDFVELMRREAETIVPLRRQHPSLAAWCGGNELTDASGEPLDETHPVLGALREVVDRLDPDRAWLPTSPSGPRRSSPLQAIRAARPEQHDAHGPWEHQGLREHHRMWDGRTALLNSEFGAEGMAGRDQVERTISSPHRWPATRSNAVWAHRGDWWINEPLVQRSFGGGLAALDELRRASRWLQAEGLRYAVESNRRRWPRNSGSLPWQFDESYPNAWSTSAIDHDGRPKPAYHAVAQAYRSVHVAASFPSPAWDGAERAGFALWAWSEGETLDGAHIEWTACTGSGRRLAGGRETIDLRADAVAGPLPVQVELGPPDDELCAFDVRLLHEGAVRATNRYVCSRTADLRPLRCAPRTVIRLRRHDDGVEVIDDGPYAALMVEVCPSPSSHGGVPIVALPDAFDLLPGESRSVRILWGGVPAAERSISARAWNSDEAAL